MSRSILFRPGVERICCTASSAEEMSVRSLAMMGWNFAFVLSGCNWASMREVRFFSERPII